MLFSIVARAQSDKNTTHQNLLWARYYNQITVNQKWSLHTEIEARMFTNPLSENLNLFRIQGRYKVATAIETGIGVAYFSVTTQDPLAVSNFKSTEYRLQQDLIWKHFICNTLLSQRLQIEERFIENTNKVSLHTDTALGFRFRYRLQAELPIWENKSQYIKAILFDEILFNCTNTNGNTKITFDQNRSYSGLQYGFNSNFAVELGYLNSYQSRLNGTAYYNRDIIRLSVFHKIKSRKKA